MADGLETGNQEFRLVVEGKTQDTRSVTITDKAYVTVVLGKKPEVAAVATPATAPAGNTWRIPVGFMGAATSFASTGGLTVGFTDSLSPSLGWFADLDIAAADLGYGAGVYFAVGESLRLGVGYQGFSGDFLGLSAYAEFNRWRVKIGLTRYVTLIDFTYALGF